MINPNNINNAHLSAKQKQQLEKDAQQNDLSYLSALAFEEYAVTNTEIDALNVLLDKKSGGSSNQSFQTIFVSVLCGLFIGVSVFFVLFQKSLTHASVFQFIEPDKPREPLNKVSANDTVFPEMKSAIPKPVEHYSSISNQLELPAVIGVAEPMNSKPIELIDNTTITEEEIIFSFSPNAPVVFISNLKVTNYRLYYFKQHQSINLSINTGLAAQYENNSSIESTRLSASENYYAHRIIQQAMKLFYLKHYTNCIEELNVLYEFNKDDANAQFYLGMCYFLTGKYNLAQLYFNKNLDNQNNIFHQESDYYLALCLLNTNQKNKAIEQLQSIVDTKGFYSARAQEILAKTK